MCGRYQLEVDPDFVNRFGIKNNISFKSNTNISPGTYSPTLISPGRQPELVKWGLVPSWEENKLKPKGLINIRTDTVLEKPWANQLIGYQRCLIPATGFYEWKKAPEKNQPYLFTTNEKYFSMAGLYTDYFDQVSNHPVRTFTILTTSPNDVVSSFHDRMPVILSGDDEGAWLSGKPMNRPELERIFTPYSNADLKASPFHDAL